ncbi:MAG: hypothetical protein V2J07_06105 [Anaerolineae bacterium]|jgi:predicted transcriptional regulator of viral defense system|nr:hypothetical protein [Anaerolineae bacterium]
MKFAKEHQLYQIAEKQAGYFSVAQAKKMDIQRNQIYRDVKRGKFIHIATGIYRFTQFPASPFEELHLAQLRTGQQGIIGFQSALYVYDLYDTKPQEIHMILPATGSRRRPGIRPHTLKLAPHDSCTFEGLRMTTVARTINDCAFARMQDDELQMAVKKALQRRLTSSEELITQAARRPKRVQAAIIRCLD